MLCIPFFYFLGLKNPKDVDPKLMVPIFDIMFPFLPEKILKPLRFGVRYHDVSISNHVLLVLGYKTFLNPQHERGACIKGLFWPPLEQKTESCFSPISSYWFIRGIAQV